MPGINIAPTRSNLRRIKQDLEFARQGFEILDKKREVPFGTSKLQMQYRRLMVQIYGLATILMPEWLLSGPDET